MRKDTEFTLRVPVKTAQLTHPPLGTQVYLEIRTCMCVSVDNLPAFAALPCLSWRGVALQTSRGTPVPQLTLPGNHIYPIRGLPPNGVLILDKGVFGTVRRGEYGNLKRASE